MKIQIVPFLLMITILPLPAQEREQTLSQEPPTGPLLKRASVPSEWTIVTQVIAPPQVAGNANSGTTGAPVNSNNPAKSPKPKVMTVIKDGSLIYEKTTNEHGDISEVWRTSAAMSTRVNAKEWIASPGVGNDFYATDYSMVDFAGFEWMGLNNFMGRGSVLGKKCIIFKSKAIVMDAEALQTARYAALTKLMAQHPGDYSFSLKDINDDQFKVDVRADIDEQTRLPVMLTYQTDQGTVTRTYSFKAPEKSLELPPEVKAVLSKFEKYLKGMSVRVAPI